MPFFGTLDTISASDVFRMLGVGRKTGILKVELGGVRRQVVLDGGLPVFCSPPGPKEWLSQNLLARTAVTERDIHDAAQLQEARGCLLGEALVELGRITEAALDEALRRKIEDLLHDIVTWRHGTFEFLEGAVPPESLPVRIAIGWESVVSTGEGRAAEIERSRRAVPDVSMRFQIRQERLAGRAPRSADEGAVLAFLKAGLAAADACQRMHAGDLEILGHVAGLLQDGVIEPLIGAVACPTAPVAETVERSSRLVRAGRSAEALALLREARSGDPRDQRLVAAFAAVEAGVRQRALQSLGAPATARLCSVSLERLNATTLTPNEAFIASRLDGDWTVAAAMRACPLGELDALALIEGMFRRGLLMTAMVAAPAPELTAVGVAAPAPERAADRATMIRPRAVGPNQISGRRNRDSEPGPGGR